MRLAQGGSCAVVPMKSEHQINQQTVFLKLPFTFCRGALRIARNHWQTWGNKRTTRILKTKHYCEEAEGCRGARKTQLLKSLSLSFVLPTMEHH